MIKTPMSVKDVKIIARAKGLMIEHAGYAPGDELISKFDEQIQAYIVRCGLQVYLNSMLYQIATAPASECWVSYERSPTLLKTTQDENLLDCLLRSVRPGSRINLPWRIQYQNDVRYL